MTAKLFKVKQNYIYTAVTCAAPYGPDRVPIFFLKTSVNCVKYHNAGSSSDMSRNMGFVEVTSRQNHCNFDKRKRPTGNSLAACRANHVGQVLNDMPDKKKSGNLTF